MRIELHLQERLAEIYRELDGLAAQAAREREDRLRGLQLASRALRQAESTEQWVQILADAAAPLGGVVQFFRVDGESLRGESARGTAVVAGPVRLVDAPAFRQVVETRETVVCLFLPSQVSAAVAGDESLWRKRAQLFPLVGKTRVLGVMLAMDGPGLDVYGMEVLLSLASAVLEMREVRSAPLIAAAPVVAPVAAAEPVVVATAAAFARRTVAGWILGQGDLVAAGRGAGDLYGAMGGLIDAARAEGGATAELHAEIVERLALGNEALLGPGYPGGKGA